MIEELEANDLYVSLLEAVRGIPALAGMADPVESAVRLGRDVESSELFSPGQGRKRIRETVRSSRALTGRERLLLLIRTIERSVIVPVDVARSTVDQLSELDGAEVELVLTVDQVLSEDQLSSFSLAAGVGEEVVIDARLVREAEDRIEALRALLTELRAEVAS